MSKLFSPVTMRGVTLRNRIGVSPMCMYSCMDGHAADWHLAHLGARAAGGAGLIIQEATAVQPVGRISPQDAGLWSDGQVEGWARVTKFVREQGAVAGMQLAHAGIKAGTARPWDGGRVVPVEAGGWQAVGVRDRAFRAGHPSPRRLSVAEIGGVVGEFVAAARRALAAGYQMVEVHAAHGYLLHSFYSPLMNDRTDEYGGSWENRTRLLLEVVRGVRGVWPEGLPLWVRVSASDWVAGGWTIEDTVRLAVLLREAGVDCVDCSSGGASMDAKIEVGPGFQVGFAERVRREAGIATAAVGLITTAAQAEEIVAGGRADVVLLGRESLRDAHWPVRAARELGVSGAVFGTMVPNQYARAW
jgi:2,4-dienoyl-CoA reductase-like NADH-dependent reductase (Old Yellow Enzyme family)